MERKELSNYWRELVDIEIIGTLTFFALIVVWIILRYVIDNRKTQRLTLFNQLPFILFSIASLICIIATSYLVIALEQSLISITFEVLLFISSILFGLPAYWLSEIIQLSKNTSITKTDQGTLLFQHKNRTRKLNKETISKVEFWFSWFRSPLPTFTIIHLKTGETEIINSLICDSTLFENELKSVNKSEHKYNFKEYQNLIEKIKRSTTAPKKTWGRHWFPQGSFSVAIFVENGQKSVPKSSTFLSTGKSKSVHIKKRHGSQLHNLK